MYVVVQLAAHWHWLVAILEETIVSTHKCLPEYSRVVKSSSCAKFIHPPDV